MFKSCLYLDCNVTNHSLTWVILLLDSPITALHGCYHFLIHQSQPCMGDTARSTNPNAPTTDFPLSHQEVLPLLSHENPCHQELSS